MKNRTAKNGNKVINYDTDSFTICNSNSSPVWDLNHAYIIYLIVYKKIDEK